MLSAVVLFAPSGTGGPAVPGLDKVVHLGVFALLAATARWRFAPSAGVLPALAGYAVGSEVVQALALPERSGDVLDVLADLVGVALGWWAVRGSARRRPDVTATPRP